MNTETVKINLDKDEALVLFEMLQGSSNFGKLDIEDELNKRAWWNLFCLLLAELAEPFQSNYLEFLHWACGDCNLNLVVKFRES